MAWRAHIISILVAFGVGLGGCASVGYYGHVARGQVELLCKREPVQEVLARDALLPAARHKLERIQQARTFASRELALPDNDSYRSFVALERDYVVWNVYAAPPLSLALKEWCYPFVGCLHYRGYFTRERAERTAATLAAQGQEVYVGGVAAYSTLGWFDDPVTSTLLAYPTPELVRLLFHELAHQRLYIGDATTFNESFAVTVAREGLRRWLDEHGDAEMRRAYRARRRFEQRFVDIILAARAELEPIYASPRSVVAKRKAKAAVLDDARRALRALARDSGRERYARWAQGLNNARLGSVADYWHYVPAFRALLAEHDGDLSAFYKAVEAVGALSRDEREARLRALHAGGE